MNIRRELAVISLVALLAGCGGGGGGGSTASTVPPVPQPTGPLIPPAGKIYLGAFVNSSAGTNATASTLLGSFEQQVGRKMTLSMHYDAWTAIFPGAGEATDAQNGRIPVISWNCGVPNAQVAAGTQDQIIGGRADAIRAYGRPIFLRYMWEMNLPDSANTRQTCYDPATDEPNDLFSPTEFVAAWDHIRAVFAAHGVTNVTWLWNPSGDGPNPAAPFYPGAGQVDWVGIDQYDLLNVPFGQTYSLYDQVTGYGKPILIAETGAHPPVQTAFLGAAAVTLQTQLPLVKGFMYFNAPGARYDWQLSPAGTAAFAAMAADPYFSATAP